MLHSRLSRIVLGASLLAAVGLTSSAGAVTLRNQASLSISNTALVNKIGSTVNVTTSGGSGAGAVTFAVTGTHCTIGHTNGHLTAAVAATCVVKATKAANGSYKAATSAAKTFSFKAASNQAALSVAATPGTALVVGMSATLSATGGSGSGAVSFATSTPNCTITAGVLTASAAASCLVTATKAAGSSASNVYNAKTGTATFAFVAPAGDTVAPSNANPDVAAMSTVVVGGSTVVPFDKTADGDQWFIWQFFHAGDHWNFTPVQAGQTITQTWHVTGSAGQALVGQTVTLETGYANHTLTWSSTDPGWNATTGNFTGVTDANGNVSFTMTCTNTAAGSAPAAQTAAAMLDLEGTNPWTRMVLIVGTPESGLPLGQLGNSGHIFTENNLAPSGPVNPDVNMVTDLPDFILVP